MTAEAWFSHQAVERVHRTCPNCLDEEVPNSVPGDPSAIGIGL
jgi:hypothetical protein